jgi:hypothetical protein
VYEWLRGKSLSVRDPLRVADLLSRGRPGRYEADNRLTALFVVGASAATVPRFSAPVETFSGRLPFRVLAAPRSVLRVGT